MIEYQGYVKEIQNDNIIFEEVTENGENDGQTIFLINDISKIACLSKNEKLLKLLNTI